MIKLVKYDYDSLPESWKKINPPEYDKRFVFLGEIEQMEGLGYYQDIVTGKPYIFDIESMKDLTEDEVTTKL
jgi:hypothetical protein